MQPPKQNQPTDSTCEEHSLPMGGPPVLANHPLRSILLTSYSGPTLHYYARPELGYS